jgi:hypothetical protein
MEFEVNKVGLGQVFSEYLGYSFRQLLHTHLQSPTEAGAVGPKVAGVPSGLKSHPTLRNQEESRCFYTVSPEEGLYKFLLKSVNIHHITNKNNVHAHPFRI